MVDLTYMNKTLALRVFILFLSCFIKTKKQNDVHFCGWQL